MSAGMVLGRLGFDACESAKIAMKNEAIPSQ